MINADTAVVSSSQLDQSAINTIRCLAIDAVHSLKKSWVFLQWR